MTREQKLEEALKLIADTFDKNHGRQDEKLLDIPKIARAALSAPKAAAVAWAATDRNGNLTALDFRRADARLSDDGDAVPLYTSPVPAITDEAVERAVEAIEGELGGVSATKEQARTILNFALLAALPGKGEGK